MPFLFFRCTANLLHLVRRLRVPIHSVSTTFMHSMAWAALRVTSAILRERARLEIASTVLLLFVQTLWLAVFHIVHQQSVVWLSATTIVTFAILPRIVLILRVNQLSVHLVYAAISQTTPHFLDVTTISIAMETKCARRECVFWTFPGIATTQMIAQTTRAATIFTHAYTRQPRSILRVHQRRSISVR